MRSSGAAGAERARGLSGVTEGGGSWRGRWEWARLRRTDPMNDQEGSCPMCIPERTRKSPEEGVENELEV